jgi:uncharacterized RDD family membrane protein YckC
VKCPKCHYLGFETGDRCKNCGYDFSLISEPELSVDPDLDIELTLRASDDTLPATVQWDDNFEHMDADALADAAALAESPTTMEIADPDPEPAPEMPREAVTRFDRRVPSLGAASLFDESDEPLIRLPVAPRAPLAVRRTPETPRLRAVLRPVPRPSRPIDASPALDFVEDPPAPVVESMTEARARTVSRLSTLGAVAVRESGPLSQRRLVASQSHPTSAEPARAEQTEVSGPFARFAAAAIDHLLLAAIDVAVVYFTLRMTGLTMADLSMLPAAPLVAFLLLVKLSYFCAFTAVGGQTIGKMAMRIRVVTAEDESVDGALAVKRTLAGVASAATLGLGFLPALVGSDRRALHDRLTRTRVVALPSA